MKLLKLKLRGAIGVRKGLGVEEVEIDFTEFQSGLIALTGPNGSGKTTILENLHPYRCMVSRDGALQSHFYLKDSYRMLEFEHNGDLYNSKILIDALTGASEAYLSCNSKPMNDGKLGTYDEAIEAVLGSSELFFNSVFSGQKSKGIAELKPAERRKLFYELLNLNVYESYLEQAKAKLKENEVKLAELEGEIKALQPGDLTIEKVEEERVGLLNEQAQFITDISKLEQEQETIQEKIHSIKVKLSVKQEAVKAEEEQKKRIVQIQSELKKLTAENHSKVSRLNGDIEDSKKLIVRNESLAMNRMKITAKLNEKKKLQGELDELKIRINGVVKKVSELEKSRSLELNNLAIAEKNISILDKEIQQIENELKDYARAIDGYERDASLIDNVPCTDEVGSGCQFLKNAYEGKGKIEEYKKKRIGLNLSYKNKLKEYHSLLEIKRTAQLESDREYSEESSFLSHDFEEFEKEYKAKESALKLIDKDNWEKLQDEAKDAENNIKLYQEKIKNTETLLQENKTNFNKELDRLSKEADDISKKIDPELHKKITELESELGIKEAAVTELNAFIKTHKERLDNYNKLIASLEQQLETIKKSAEKVEVLKADKSKIENAIRDWSFLCKAFDKTGIPVLKLENSGIEITSIANELLSIFENKFRIVFETTKLKADKKNYKESFDINIVEEDGVCEIGNKSGGQQVWLETAIQLAISQVVRQQGRNVQTSFLDEKDGALDLDNAYSYIEMLKKAHQLSGVYNTFIITHRVELLDFIPQQIKLKDGLLQVVN